MDGATKLAGRVKGDHHRVVHSTLSVFRTHYWQQICSHALCLAGHSYSTAIFFETILLFLRQSKFKTFSIFTSEFETHAVGLKKK